jgi:L-idonate 5-dehydrogenase
MAPMASSAATVSTDTMKAGVLHGSRDVRMTELRVPAPGPGQVRLRVSRAGICGSDIHYYQHGYCGRFVPTRPFVLGHEFVGTIDAVGEGVESPAVGQRVVVNPASSCGHCEECRSGRGNLCATVGMLGSASTTPPTDGAFAEYVVAPARQCYAVPEGMSDAEAALMEPLSVALHAIARAGSVAGKRVLITGGGPIGLLTARAARALGAALVAVSEPSEARRQRAAELAADDVLDPVAAEFTKTAIKLSDGGFDAVFEASGAAAAVRGAIDVARRGGVIVQIGTVGGNDVTLPVNDIMVRELSLLGTFRYADEFPQAIRLVASGRVNFDGLVTATAPLAELPAAFETACRGESIKVHVLVEAGR